MNPYEILGCNQGDDLKVIQKKYKTLVKTHHPDLFSDPIEKEKATKKLNEIIEAYSQLQKKSVANITENAFPYFNSPIEIGIEFKVNEIFSDNVKVIEFNRAIGCTTCSGFGGFGTKSNCGICRGSGKIIDFSGFMAIEAPCHQCQGKGCTFTQSCTTCSSQGYTVQHVQETISIPKQSAGRPIKYEGKGHRENPFKNPGDLFIHIQIVNNDNYEFYENGDIKGKFKVNIENLKNNHQIILPSGKFTELTLKAHGKSGDIYTIENEGFKFAKQGNYLAELELEY